MSNDEEEFDLPNAEEYFPPSDTYHSVLFTAELLERILFSVDTKTLLLSQQVCTFWRNTIQGSQLLQRSLFFSSDLLWHTRFIPASDGSCIMTSFHINDSGREPLTKPIRNQLLHPALKGHMDCDSELNGWTIDLLNAHKLGNFSWRRMFITQPALTGVFLIYGSDHIEGTTYLSNEYGIRAGDVADELEDLARRLGSRNVSVKSIVGSDFWQVLEDNSQIEALVDSLTIMPPTHGLDFRPRYPNAQQSG